MYRIIAISGTPGTGKTDVARILAKKLDANLIEISKLVKGRKVPSRTDKKRQTKIIDTRLLQKAITKEMKKDSTNIIEGHLSHFLRTDFIIILRTDPSVLKNRLKKRRWSKSKILENIQAEIIDEITAEAIKKHGKRKIIEIDTSKMSKTKTAQTILKILINPKLRKKYPAGKTRWLKKYYKLLE